MSARENTLNFFNPRRRFDARRRILENTAHFWNNDDDADGTNAARNGQDSTVNYLDAYSANSFNSRMVHFEVRRVFIYILVGFSSKFN